ncbi:MAG: DUF3683 domain-containing protein [Lentisphaerales bacterium]|nr:DUF3683 domain-containing protein [Lentisphaerales bacterium]
MEKINVASNHKAGRQTQVMMDNFGDLADMVNNKLLDKLIHTEHKKEILTDVLNHLNAVIEKTEKITHGPHVQRIVNKLRSAAEDLDLYIDELEKSGR